MDSVLSNEVARRIAADLATLVSEAEKHGTLPRIKSVAFYFNETELRTIIKLLRSRHGILDPAQASRLTPSELHAINHARYRVDRATPESPECCFDYELVRDLVSICERYRALAHPSADGGPAA